MYVLIMNYYIIFIYYSIIDAFIFVILCRAYPVWGNMAG
jgi:hypothetical protein